MESYTEEIKRKKQFVYAIRAALLIDHERSGFKDMEYSCNKGREEIQILFDNNQIIRINTSANSNSANMLEIYRAVYGTGAIGQMR